MTLEELHALWDIDCKINIDKLDEVSLVDTPQLHSKYMKLYSVERLKLKALKVDMNKLRHAKEDFLVEGPAYEDYTKAKENGWELPGRGRVIRSDVDRYLNADPDITKLELKLAYQQEKVDYLKEIVDRLNNRSFQIKNALEFIRWSQGG